MGKRIFRVTAEALCLHLKESEHARRINEGIHPEAELVEAGYVPDERKFYLIVEHESYEVHKEGTQMEAGTVMIENIPAEVIENGEEE